MSESYLDMEYGELYLYIDALRKKLDDREVTIVALCAEEKSIKDERDTLRKQLEVAKRALNFMAIEYNSYMSKDALSEIERLGKGGD
jgi:hypothetical protein